MRDALLRQLYAITNRLMPCDITYLLVSSLGHPLVTGDTPGCVFKQLSPDELQAWVDQHELELNRVLIDAMTTRGLRCYGVISDSTDVNLTESVEQPETPQLLGYLMCANGVVPARYNSAGSPFRGVGLDLPVGVSYVFKCFVLPSQRGKRLLQRLLAYAATGEMAEHKTTHFVTTTDWANRAASTSFQRFGFERVGLVGEFVIGRRHLYRLPAPVALDDAVAAPARQAAVNGSAEKRPAVATDSSTLCTTGTIVMCRGDCQ